MYIAEVASSLVYISLHYQNDRLTRADSCAHRFNMPNCRLGEVEGAATHEPKITQRNDLADASALDLLWMFLQTLNVANQWHQNKKDKIWQLILAYFGMVVSMFPYVGVPEKKVDVHHEVFPARRWAALSLCPLGPMWARQRLGPIYGCCSCCFTSEVVIFSIQNISTYPSQCNTKQEYWRDRALEFHIWIFLKGCMNFGQLVLVKLWNYSWNFCSNWVCYTWTIYRRVSGWFVGKLWGEPD